MSEEKQRVIQEYVPGKQITLAHVIANPKQDVCKKLGLNTETTKCHRHSNHRHLVKGLLSLLMWPQRHPVLK